MLNINRKTVKITYYRGYNLNLLRNKGIKRSVQSPFLGILRNVPKGIAYL